MELLHVAEINAVTGYIRGGCSPVGMKKAYPVIFHQTALDYETIYISGGRIGAQVEAAPETSSGCCGRRRRISLQTKPDPTQRRKAIWPGTMAGRRRNQTRMQDKIVVKGPGPII